MIGPVTQPLLAQPSIDDALRQLARWRQGWFPARLLAHALALWQAHLASTTAAPQATASTVPAEAAEVHLLGDHETSLVGSLFATPPTPALPGVDVQASAAAPTGTKAAVVGRILTALTWLASRYAP